MIATKKEVSLKNYNTFGIDVKAHSFVSIETDEALKNILQKKTPEQPLFVIGGGSNMLLTKDVHALVLHINSKGKQLQKKEHNHVLVNVQAGENWHEFVQWCIEQNLGGIENLSLIPGNCGAAPIQNIGAYGVELKDVFHSCEAISIATAEKRTFLKEECKFGYRDSIFKNEIKGEYIITNITLRLTTNNHVINDSYGAIKSELAVMNVSNPTIKDISEAVIAIRRSKLPDPAEIGNSGSFFKNPVIGSDHFEKLKEQFPDIPSYIIDDEHVKVPAGWLIEQAGFKGKRLGNYGVHEKQALVLVNYDNADGNDIKKLAFIIRDTIERLFNIRLEVEVNIF